MQVQLLVSDWSPSRPRAEKVWREVAAEYDFALEILDVAQPEGQKLMRSLQLKTIPAVVIDGALVAIGVQSNDEARKIITAAFDKK